MATKSTTRRRRKPLSEAAIVRWEVMNLTQGFQREKAVALRALDELRYRCYGSPSLEEQARTTARIWAGHCRETWASLKSLIITGKPLNKGGQPS